MWAGATDPLRALFSRGPSGREWVLVKSWGPESSRHSAGKLSSHEASGLWAARGPCLASGAPFAGPVHSLAASLAPKAGGHLGPPASQQASAPGHGASSLVRGFLLLALCLRL